MTWEGTVWAGSVSCAPPHHAGPAHTPTPALCNLQTHDVTPAAADGGGQASARTLRFGGSKLCVKRTPVRDARMSGAGDSVVFSTGGLAQGLKQLWGEGTLCECTLVTDDGSALPCHKVCLAAASG